MDVMGLVTYLLSYSLYCTDRIVNESSAYQYKYILLRSLFLIIHTYSHKKILIKADNPKDEKGDPSTSPQSINPGS